MDRGSSLFFAFSFLDFFFKLFFLGCELWDKGMWAPFPPAATGFLCCHFCAPSKQRG